VVTLASARLSCN